MEANSEARPTCHMHELTFTGEFCSQISGSHIGRDSGWKQDSHIRTAGHPNEQNSCRGILGDLSFPVKTLEISVGRLTHSFYLEFPRSISLLTKLVN